MAKVLELCNADINKALFKDVKFFSIAETGAMGDPGGVLFYVKTGELYHFNYLYGDVDIRKVQDKFPTLAKCKFGLFGIDSSVPEGWKYVSLGAGNHLIVEESLYEDFMKEFPKDIPSSILYANWIDVAEKKLNANRK